MDMLKKFTAYKLSQKSACATTGWTPAPSCSNPNQHCSVPSSSSSVDDPWMLNLRHCQYLYKKDDSDDDGGGVHRSLHPQGRFPRYGITSAATYEPPFVDCSSLFDDHHHQRGLPLTQDDNIIRLHDSNSSTHADFQNGTWTMTKYQSMGSHRRQHHLNYSSQYFSR